MRPMPTPLLLVPPSLLVPLSLLVGLSAYAADGVLEINQTCAVQTGCFAGDTLGFPVTITTPGSYRLSSNLNVPNENTDAILVSANDVSVDLAGFAILGPVVCAGTPLVCTPAAGSGSGVTRSAPTNRGISVQNGSISGMGGYGVRLGDHAEVTNLRVRWNLDDGIFASFGSTVSGNSAFRNARSGIVASTGSTITGNSVYQNGADGITAGSNSTVSRNSSILNGADGIASSSGSTVIGNTSSSNGDATSPTTDDGIECAGGCTVRSNTVRANAGYGLNLSLDSAYGDNTVTANTTGTVTGSGSPNSRGGNYCAGTGTISISCP